MKSLNNKNKMNESFLHRDYASAVQWLGQAERLYSQPNINNLKDYLNFWTPRMGIWTEPYVYISEQGFRRVYTLTTFAMDVLADFKPGIYHLCRAIDLMSISVTTVEPLMATVAHTYPAFEVKKTYGDGNVWFKGKFEYRTENLTPFLGFGAVELAINGSIGTLLREGRFERVCHVLQDNPS